MKTATTVSVCVPLSVLPQIYLSSLSNFMAAYARCFADNILWNSSQGHWEDKSIAIAAGGTVSRCFPL